MGKLFKILLYLVGAVAVLVLVAVLAVTLFIDPNDYKDRIEAMVEERTGRELAIDGDIRLSFFPWIGVETGPAVLSNAEGFGPEPFARMEHAGIKVRLLPLIRKQVEVDTIILRGATVHLARDAQGRTNWEDLIPEGQQPSDTETVGGGLAGLVVAGIQLRNSTVTWRDAVTGTQYSASEIDLETSEVAFGRPFDVRLGMELSSETSPISARLTLNARPTINPDTQVFRLDDLEFRARSQVSGDDEPLPLDFGLRANAVLDLAAGTGELSDLELRAWNVRATGSAELSQLNTTPAYSAELDVLEFSPAELLSQLHGEAPETADDGVLQRAGASLVAEGTTESVTLGLQEAYLDDTNIHGSLSIDPLAEMAMRFQLDIGAINLDRYLSPGQQKAAEDAPLASPGEAVAAGGSLIPVETLRGLNLNGTVRAESLTMAGVTATDIEVTVKAADGQVRIHPLQADFYQGRYSGDVRIDATGERPRLSMDEHLQGVQAGPLLQDAAGRAWMTGLGDMKLTSTADLSSPEAAKRSLSGQFEFDFSNGAIFGINIAQRIRQAVSLLQGGAMDLERGEARTDFSSFTVKADMDSGVIRANTVRLVSPLLEISGGGTIDLSRDQVDLTFTPVLSEAMADQAGESLRQLTGKPIPLKFSGSLLEPKISLDVASALRGRVEDQVREEVGRRLMDALGGRDEEPEQEQAPAEPPAQEKAETGDADDGLTAAERKAQRQTERRKARQEAREQEQTEGDDGGG